MKNSYYQTPRRSEDCTFHSWADPIHRDDNAGKHDPDTIVLTVAVLIIIFIGAMALAGLL